MRFQLIDRQRSKYKISMLCAILDVSRSGYYAWKKHKPSQREETNQVLLEHICRIHKLSRKAYGSPRMHFQLRKEGLICNRKRVVRLMHLAGLQGRRKRRRVVTTDSRHTFPIAPNHLNRDFTAVRPNQKWVADITYIPTQEGWLYLAGVMDLFSRKIVGWNMSGQLDTSLVENALLMAFYQRQPDHGLLHHSDRGCQYASATIRTLLADHRVIVSMSGKGNCYDNAVMESFWGTLKNEWVHHQKYLTRAQARTDIFGYIEGFYNTVRLHSSLGYSSPVEFEANNKFHS